MSPGTVCSRNILLLPVWGPVSGQNGRSSVEDRVRRHRAITLNLMMAFAWNGNVLDADQRATGE